MRTQGALGRGHSPWAGTHHTEGLATAREGSDLGAHKGPADL